MSLQWLLSHLLLTKTIFIHKRAVHSLGSLDMYLVINEYHLLSKWYTSYIPTTMPTTLHGHPTSVRHNLWGKHYHYAHVIDKYWWYQQTWPLTPQPFYPHDIANELVKKVNIWHSKQPSRNHIYPTNKCLPCIIKVPIFLLCTDITSCLCRNTGYHMPTNSLNWMLVKKKKKGKWTSSY